jgi:hypothetical protein
MQAENLLCFVEEVHHKRPASSRFRLHRPLQLKHTGRPTCSTTPSQLRADGRNNKPPVTISQFVTSIFDLTAVTDGAWFDEPSVA